MRFFILALSGYLLLSCGSWLAENPKQGVIIFTQPQINQLVRIIKSNTPENRFGDGPVSFQWVCLNMGENIPADLKAAIVKEFKSYYQVYLERKDIAEQSIKRSGNDIIGYRNGFLFTVKIMPKGENSIELTTEDYEANLSSSGETMVYTWNGSDWVASKKGLAWIS